MSAGPRRSLRLLPIALAVIGVVLYLWVFAPRETEIFLRLPEEAVAAEAFDVRMSKADDGAMVLRTRVTRAEPASRSLVVRTRLTRGRYLAEVWPRLDDDAPPRYEGRFAAAGQDVIDVPLGRAD